MRSILFAAGLVALSACSGQAAPTTEIAPVTAPQADTRLLAVISYADWCGSCRVLDPKVKAVEASGGISGVEYVTLDYTARDADAFFADADTAGIGPVIRARFDDKIKTGFLMLIDLDDGTIVQEIKKDMAEPEIAAAIAEAASAA